MTNENHSNNAPADPEGQPPPQPPVVPPAPAKRKIGNDPKKSTDTDQKTAKELAREFRWVEGAQLVINGVLAIVGIIALLIYHGQLDVMRGQLGEIVKQYPEIKKSADANVAASKAATESLNAIKAQFQADQRPYALASGFRMFNFDTRNPGPPVAGKPLMANAEFKNYGKTPALNVIIHAHIISGESDVLHKLKAEPPDVKTNGAIVPQGEVFSKTVVSVKDAFKYEDGLGFPI